MLLGLRLPLVGPPIPLLGTPKTATLGVGVILDLVPSDHTCMHALREGSTTLSPPSLRDTTSCMSSNTATRWIGCMARTCSFMLLYATMH